MSDGSEKERLPREQESHEPFLTRWSKRKTEGRQAARQPPQTPDPEPDSVDPDKPFDPQAFELPIPDLDAITAGFDMRPFLQKGVPESLKNAALRKLWTIDPAIAGFVSPALDYAHDYNTPGAAPGFGPLVGDQDLTQLMQNLFSRDPAEPVPQVEALDKPERETGMIEPDNKGIETGNDHSPAADSGNKNNDSSLSIVQNDQYPKSLDEDQKTQARRPLRHGSAIPQ